MRASQKQRQSGFRTTAHRSVCNVELDFGSCGGAITAVVVVGCCAMNAQAIASHYRPSSRQVLDARQVRPESCIGYVLLVSVSVWI